MTFMSSWPKDGMVLPTGGRGRQAGHRRPLPQHWAAADDPHVTVHAQGLCPHTKHQQQQQLTDYRHALIFEVLVHDSDDRRIAMLFWFLEFDERCKCSHWVWTIVITVFLPGNVERLWNYVGHVAERHKAVIGQFVLGVWRPPKPTASSQDEKHCFKLHHIFKKRLYQGENTVLRYITFSRNVYIREKTLC